MLLCMVLTNDFGFVNTITKVENGKQTIVYKTPTTVLLVEFAFWEGNLLLIICFIAGLLDVRKRRFLVKPITADNNGLTEKPEPIEPIKPKTEMPKILKAFQKPEFSNKGAAFSNEFSTKPGEKPRFLNDEDKKISAQDCEIMYNYLNDLPSHTFTWHDVSFADNDETQVFL